MSLLNALISVATGGLSGNVQVGWGAKVRINKIYYSSSLINTATLAPFPTVTPERLTITNSIDFLKGAESNSGPLAANQLRFMLYQAAVMPIELPLNVVFESDSVTTFLVEFSVVVPAARELNVYLIIDYDYL